MTTTHPRRRLLFLLAVPIALVVLFLLGRQAVTAAPTPSPSDSTRIADDASAPVDDAALALAAEVSASADAGAESESSVGAIETLPDGGYVVDINRATEAELRKLPGIGVVRARAIVALRSRIGRFRSVDDLARIKGLGRGALRRIRPFARVGS